MTREDRRLVRRGAGCIVFAFALLYLTGQLMLWMYPLSDLDKKCMSKTMMELPECWNDRHKP